MTRPTLLLLTVLLALTFAFAHAGAIRERRQAIPREFQNVNIENYLKNPRAVAFQLKCVIDEGPCDRIGKYLKVTIPELLTNQCRNCSPDQRRQAGRLVAYIQQNYKKEWAAAVKKFQGGQTISAAEVSKFENDFGVKIDGVSTLAPAAGEAAPAGPVVTEAPVSLSEVGSIVKGFAASAKDLAITPKEKAAAESIVVPGAAPAAKAAAVAPAAA